MTDRWTSQVIVCKGGLIQSQDVLSQGTVNPGTATVLQNYEPALEGGYRRISGFAKWDSNAISGATNSPILGVKAAHGGVYAARENSGSTSVDIFFSTGSGWGTKINSANQSTSSTKYRIIRYFLNGTETVTFTDGQGPALKYNGSADTLLNATGAPAAPKYAEFILNRLVLADDNNLYLTAPNTDTDFDGSNGAIQILISDKIIGLKRFRGTLYIFCESSILKLTGNNVSNFIIEPVTRQIGCISGDTVEEVAGDLVFLAPDGIRSLAATERIGDIDLGLLSRNIQPTVRQLVGSFGEDNWSSCTVRKKSQYRLFIREDGVPDAESVGILGKLEPEGGYAWSLIAGMNAYSADSEYDSENEVVVFGHPTDGFVYRQEQGNDFDGSDIFSVYSSPEITFDDATLRKVMQQIDVYTQAEGDIETALQVLLDFNNPDVPQPQPITLTQTGDLDTYGTGVYGTAVYSAIQLPVFRETLCGSGFTVKFQYVGSNTKAAHRIDSYQIQFGIKGRR